MTELSSGYAVARALLARAAAFVDKRPLPPIPEGSTWAASATLDVSPLDAPAIVADRWRALGAPELLIRALDDARRMTLLGHVTRARRSPGEEAAVASVSETLGEPRDWVVALDRYGSHRLARLVLIPTWECELRCSYCWIPKQSGRVMTREVADKAIELLMSSRHDKVNLQFFGGEALMEWELVKHCMEHAEALAAELGKTVDFVLSSNGWTVREHLPWITQHDVKLELSLDGDPDTQETWRRSNVEGEDSYQNSIAFCADDIINSGLLHDVIMVVQPRSVSRLCSNFFHIADLGFRRIQINVGLGMRWPSKAQSTLAEQLFEISAELGVRAEHGQPITLINAENGPLPVRLNGEVHVDFDGTVYNSNGFLNETDKKAEFAQGHLNDLKGFDRYWVDSPDNQYLLDRTYPPEITENNLKMGRIMSSFVKWVSA